MMNYHPSQTQSRTNYNANTQSQHHYNTNPNNTHSNQHISSSRNAQNQNHHHHQRSSHHPHSQQQQQQQHQQQQQQPQQRMHRMQQQQQNVIYQQQQNRIHAIHSVQHQQHHHQQQHRQHQHQQQQQQQQQPQQQQPQQQQQQQQQKQQQHHQQQQQHQTEVDSDKKFIISSTARIIDLAGISSKSDTADLIQRSVRQHVFYENMLLNNDNNNNNNNKSSSNSNSSSSSNGGKSKTSIMDYICQLTELNNRESALSALSKLRENNPDLAPLLWGTPAVIAALIQEVISVYPYLSGNIEMNSNHSNRCCNALALLQCVASHPETRGLFLKAYIPLFLYPFLNTELNSRPFEYLRLTSLGVIGALVKHPHPISNINNNNNNNHKKKKNIKYNNTYTIPDSEVTEFLVKTEAIPLCLHIMEYGNELSQTVATFIIQKILLDDYGLNYVCKTSDRFFAISQVLTKMIQDPIKKPSKKLIKHVVRCYLRLCDDNRAYLALHSVLPKYLQSQQVENLIGDDENCLNWLKQLRLKHKESLIAQQRSQQQKQQYLQQRVKKQQQQQQQQQQNQHHHSTQQYQHNQYSNQTNSNNNNRSNNYVQR